MVGRNHRIALRETNASQCPTRLSQVLPNFVILHVSFDHVQNTRRKSWGERQSWATFLGMEPGAEPAEKVRFIHSSIQAAEFLASQPSMSRV